MPLIIIAVLIYFAYKFKTGQSAAAPRSTGSRTGKLGGSNIPGNSFDNGSADTLGPGPSCDCPTDSSLVYATAGGEDGSSPTYNPPRTPSAPITVGNGYIAPGGDPAALSMTPTTTTAKSAVNNRHRFVRSA